MRTTRKPRKVRRNSQGVRIIGGTWRGRRLEVCDAPGLRPTPDRVRETLFNWLMPHIQGARCLDLFAGSGLLAFEALSRGAKQATLIEKQRTAVQQLQKNKQMLAAHPATILHKDTLEFLNTPPTHPFDLVFVDPPYAANLITQTCEYLSNRIWLAPHARIYLEYGKDYPPPKLPDNWTILKEKTTSSVHYRLMHPK